MGTQLPYIIIMIVQFIIIVVLIITDIRLNKKNKKNKALITNYKEKLREDELDAAIMNACYKQDKAVNDWKNTPYSVDFEDEKKVRTTNAICVHLECQGRLANRKYIINIKDELYLGKAKNNGVIFDEVGVDKKHIHFVRQFGELYVQNVSQNMPAVFVREDSKYELTDVLVKVNDGDRIEFEDSFVRINLI